MKINPDEFNVQDLFLAWARACGYSFTKEAKNRASEAIDRIEKSLGCDIFTYANRQGWLNKMEIERN